MAACGGLLGLIYKQIHPGFCGRGHVWGPVIRHIPSLISSVPIVGALIFRDHGKRTENTEMAFGNGKCNFKRKITENHFSAGKNNKIHKIYKISQTKWIYFHATLPRIRVYIYNTHLYVNGISNILYVQSLWENGISIFPPYWNGIEDFQKRKRQFFETENQYPNNELFASAWGCNQWYYTAARVISSDWCPTSAKTILETTI